jgi:hypothetical protein
MKQARTPRLFVAVAVAALTGAIAFVPAAGVRADEVERCTVATQGESPIAKACQEGGIRQAKRKMKELVRTARERGMYNECNDCHEGGDSWTLVKGANDRFRKLLEITR